MLSKEENELLTRVHPGTPMGRLFRRYWIPALLSEEIPDPDCPPVRVRLLGEDLVAFRDTQGRIGLLGRALCPSRHFAVLWPQRRVRPEVHLSRLEVRRRRPCARNPRGTCRQPAEKQSPSYRLSLCRGGRHGVHLHGSAEKKCRCFQPTPGLECRRSKFTSRRVFWNATIFKALDGDCDSAHLNFLHKMFKPDARREFLRHEDQSPDFEIDEMDFGFRVAAIRKIAPDKNYVRISQFVMPFIGCVPVGREVDGKLDGFKAVYQVPADDHNTWRYDFFFKWSKPMTKEDSSKRDFVGADYRKLRNIRNNYLQDRQVQKTVNFTGIEEFLNQDACATESMGPIVDRRKEHLGASDSYLIQVRRFLLKAVRDVQAGKPPPGLVYDPAQADFSRIRCDVAYLPADVSWRTLFE